MCGRTGVSDKVGVTSVCVTVRAVSGEPGLARRNLCEVWAAQEAEPRRAAFLPHLPRTNAQVREAGAGYCKSKLTWHLHSRDREGERHEAKSKRREPRFATGERHLNHLDTETHMTT